MIGGFQLGTQSEWISFGVEMIIAALLVGAFLMFVTNRVARKFGFQRSAKFIYALEALIVLAICIYAIWGIIQLLS